MSKDNTTIIIHLQNYNKQQLKKLSSSSTPLGMIEVDIICDTSLTEIVNCELDLSQQKATFIKQFKQLINQEVNRVVFICGNKAFIADRSWLGCQLPSPPVRIRLSRISSSFNCNSC